MTNQGSTKINNQIPIFFQKDLFSSEMVSSLNNDLLNLLELGAFERVFELMRSYNYYNIIGAQAYLCLVTSRFSLLEELILEYVTGVGEIVDFNGNVKLYEDVDYAVFILFFLKKSNQVRFALTEDILNAYENDSIFSRFISREGLNYSLDGSDIRKVFILWQRSLDRKFDISKKALRKNKISFNFYNPLDTVGERINNETSLTIFQQALANIETYIEGQSSKFYKQSLLKTDFIYIRDFLSPDAIRELAQRAGVFDLYPLVINDYLKINKYTEAIESMIELYTKSSLWRNEDSFVLERVKEYLRNVALEIYNNLNSDQREEYGSFIIQLISEKEYKTFLFLCAGGVCNDRSSLPVELKELLVKPQIMIIEDEHIEILTGDLMEGISRLQHRLNSLR